MTDVGQTDTEGLAPFSAVRQKKLRKRYAAEKRFRFYGLTALGLALAALAVLMFSFVSQGYTAFWQSQIKLTINLDEARLDPKGTRDKEDLRKAGYRNLLIEALRTQFSDVQDRRDVRALLAIISSGAETDLRNAVVADPSLLGQSITLKFPVSDDADMLFKGVILRNVPESDRRLSDQQIAWLDALSDRGLITQDFNTRLLTAGDSREPELAGLFGAFMGSLYTMLITLALSFPVGVAAAVYLQEFAPKNRLTDLIEVNINNLAAVPSIVFGLLGLAVFLNFFGLPRSSPLVGGLVLALMTLPIIIIAARASLQAVPPSIREAARGVGASEMQTMSHHVLPLAMPGILTGTIIGMSRALGESAPLLMIGMVAFVADIPSNVTSPATALPVQVFLWAASPEQAFVEKTAAAIILLLVFLIAMNATAIFLRRKFEQRW